MTDFLVVGKQELICADKCFIYDVMSEPMPLLDAKRWIFSRGLRRACKIVPDRPAWARWYRYAE